MPYRNSAKPNSIDLNEWLMTNIPDSSSVRFRRRSTYDSITGQSTGDKRIYICELRLAMMGDFTEGYSTESYEDAFEKALNNWRDGNITRVYCE